jgi:signal transduction histidine kinase
MARVGLRVRLAVAIAGISALVAIVSGLVVYQRVSVDHYAQARASAVESAQALSREVAAGRTSLPAGVSIVRKGASDPIGTLYDKFQVLTILRHSGSLVTPGHGRVIASTPLRGGGQLYLVRSLAPVRKTLTALRNVLIFVGLGAILAGAAMGLFAATLLVRPLRRAAELARRLAGGDLDARLAPTGRDEVAQLGRALDDMAAALDRRMRDLDESAERERRFSADVAHELRTPLTGIVAAADLLNGSEAAHTVRRRASDLARLVDELLEVMRLDGDGESADASVFDLAALVRDVARERAPDATVTGPESLLVASDARRVERVLANLLDNAVQHGSAPIAVDIDGAAVVAVHDSGPGFGVFLPRAGERFATASAARGAGFGLGLAIARGQANVLGAELELADDRGALATLRLPMAALEVPREALS